MDVLLAASALVSLMPLLILIALMVRISSPGPALFKQVRYGQFRQPFVIFKFRTMVAQSGESHFLQAQKGDARVTWLGCFLRRTSLDELPQLWNVLHGSMSLVGPRPHPTALDDHFEPLISGYHRRYSCKPGMTGLAQVSGHRGATLTTASMQSRVQLDLHYIDHWSHSGDVNILCRTVPTVLFDTNAF